MNSKRKWGCAHGLVRYLSKRARSIRSLRRAMLMSAARGAGSKLGLMATSVIVIWVRHRF